MRAIIVGAGEVGYHIAEKMSREGHAVTVIEKNLQREKSIRDKVNALVLHGSGADTDTLLEAGVENADLFVAVTESDEANLVACLLAAKYNPGNIVCRVSSPGFWGEQNRLAHEEMGIDLIINPQAVVANEICQLVTYTEARDAAEFANGRVVFIGHPIEEGSPLAGVSLKHLRDIRGIYRLVVSAIQRDGESLIPRGNDTIELGDIVYFVCKKEDLPSIRYLFGDQPQNSKRGLVMILGGGRVGYGVASSLANRGYRVKVVERSAVRARELAETLERVQVVNTEATDLDTLHSEGIDQAEVFVAVTDDDQTNMIAALLAKRQGAARAIVLINQPELLTLAPSLGIEVSVSPRQATANAILKHVRQGQVLNVATIEQSQAEVMELIVPAGHALVGTTLKNLAFPEGANIGAIVRAEQVIIPEGDDEILSEDHLVIFCLPEAVHQIETLFS